MTYLFAPPTAYALHLSGGWEVTARPARPDDADMLQGYVRDLSVGSRYNRFFGALSELPAAELDRLTHMDQRDGAELIAEIGVADTPTMIGEACYAVLVDSFACEFAISVADAWRCKGLGSLLLADLQCRVRAIGIRTLIGDVLRSNEMMLAFARKAGFSIAPRSGEPRAVRIVKDISYFSGADPVRALASTWCSPGTPSPATKPNEKRDCTMNVEASVPSTIKADFLEAGSGPTVMLVHSSVSGARQWRSLMDYLKADFHVMAVNLFGYGKTAPWPDERVQTLDDQARLVEAALPPHAGSVCLVGHSFGGTVAMKVAARLSGRVARLVLLEANPFDLLRQAGRAEALAEVMQLRNYIKNHGVRGQWSIAAEKFADYWGGAGSWSAMAPERRSAFADALKPNFFEWDAVMDNTPVAQWAQLLPAATLVVSDTNTARPIREIVELFRQSCPTWTYKEIAAGGHMAPLSRPDLINPLVHSFLRYPLAQAKYGANNLFRINQNIRPTP